MSSGAWAFFLINLAPFRPVHDNLNALLSGHVLGHEQNTPDSLTPHRRQPVRFLIWSILIAIAAGQLVAQTSSPVTAISILAYNTPAQPVDPTGRLDSTAGIQAAISATADGASLFIPVGTYLISKSLVLTRPITLFGEGIGSVLLVAANTGPKINAINITPAYPIYSMNLRDFAIAPQSGMPGQHGIYIDTSSYTISGLTIERLRIGQLGGWAIYGYNTQMNGLAVSRIRDSSLSGGVKFVQIGDSVSVESNVIRSAIGACVEFDQVTATLAKLLRIRGNNMDCKGGAIWITGGATMPITAENNIEQFSSGLTTQIHSALIDLDGTPEHEITGAEIYGNSIGATTFNIVDSLRINYASFTNVHDNLISRSGPVYIGRDLQITPNAKSTLIRYNLYLPYLDALEYVIVDNGVGTVFEVPAYYGLGTGACPSCKRPAAPQR